MNNEKQKCFLDVFYKYTPNDSEKAVLDTILGYKYRINKESRRIEIDLFFDKLVDKSVLYSIENSIKTAYELNGCFIFPKYPPMLFDVSYFPEILRELKRSINMVDGFFDNSKVNMEGDVITIDFNGGLHMLPECGKCDLIIRKIIKSEFSLDKEIRFSGEKFDMEKYIASTSYEMPESQIISSEKEKEEAPTETVERKRSIYKSAPEHEIKNDGKTVNVGFLTFDLEKRELLWGKEIKELDKMISIEDIEDGKKGIVFCGKVFLKEVKEGKTGSRSNFTFHLTDEKSAIKMRFYADGAKKDVFDTLKEGVSIMVEGDVKTDDFWHEPIVIPKNVEKIGFVPRTDNAPKKRVELHLHTQLSSMDAIVPPSDIVKLAKEWGHSAIAITDHGNLQAFPSAQTAAKKAGIKVLYGMEAYYVDDTAKALYGESHENIETGQFVFFDLETTGLSAFNCQIIEIGAVKLKDGEIVDTFSTFADPGIEIPAEITKITGISTDMVKGAPTPLEATKAFLEFAGNSLLIAHNAPFDISFVKKVCSDNGIIFDNPYLDTVALSRYVNPTLKKHNLAALREYYKLEEFNHHRALDDTVMLSKVYMVMAERLKDEGISTFSEMTTAMSEKCDPKKLNRMHLTILAKNETGLKNLYKLVSSSYLEYFRYKPRIPKTLIAERREGLLIGSACSQGELFNAILEGKSYGELLKIADFYDYFEIMPLSNNSYLVPSRLSSFDQIKEINKKIIDIARKQNKLCVATGDVHYINKQDKIFRDIIVNRDDESDGEMSLHMRTTDEMLKEFSYLGEKLAYEVVVENTNKIADMIDELKPIPDGSFPPHIEGAEEELRNACLDRATSLFGDPLPEIVQTRLFKELDSIIKHGYAVLYITARRLVKRSEELGYLVGSRGSVGSSFAATMSGISEVDPLPPYYLCPNCKHSEFITDGSYGSGFDLPKKNCPVCNTDMKRDGHDIPFETFLGFNGDKAPDIDLNFSGDVQSEIHKYTEILFGAENVFRAGTVSTLADKTAYGLVKKYLEEKNISLNSSEESRLALGCSGVKKTTGQHPGGIIVLPRGHEIYEFTPLQRPADGEGRDVVTTHFAYEYLHETLLKLDLLGHDVPTKYKMLETYTNKSVMDVPMDDKNVYELFLSTKSLGVSPEDISSNVGTYGLPEFGTKYVRQMLEDTKPKCFADLLQISGLSHGTDVWLGNAQELIKDNVCTISDVVGTRDNIMVKLIYYGLDKAMAFSIMEHVRKKDKNLTPEMEDEMRKHDVPEWYIESCKKIKYMFPKAHAAAYVISAIRLAWFKVYYPLEFYCAYFSAEPDGFEGAVVMQGITAVRKYIEELEGKGNQLNQKEKKSLSAMQLVNEMMSRGIKVLPVDLYKSDAFRFIPENGKMRIPFSRLAGVGESAAENICNAMKNEQIHSIVEFKEKTGVSKTVLETLRQNGVLDVLPETDQISMF